jgi:ABC-type multidrug transport system fused ATPase/permease subunit
LVADALKFIKKFKKGLDTVIGQRGVKLSEGEVQRMAIARALLKKSKFFY